jgi:hypothetical protein
MNYTREIIEAMFADHRVLQVTFIKEKDGSERKMICTKDLGLVPTEKWPKSPPKTPSEESCNVWELEVGWRSFKYKNIIDVVPGEPYVEV